MTSQRVFSVAISFVAVLIFCGCGGGNDTLENAEVLVNLGKYDKALELLDAATLEDPKNVDIYLMKGRVYLGLGDLAKADDAFGDAIAVGGKSAARKIDETIMAQFNSSLDNSFPPDDRKESAVFESAIDGLGLLSEDKLKTEALESTFDVLVQQDDQDPGYYRQVSDLFKRRVGLADDAVQTEFVSAVEQLAKRSGDGNQYKVTAKNLMYGVQPDEDKVRIEKILEKYRTDIDIAQDTMADMRTIGTCMESYAVDYARYPEGASLSSIRPLLEPTYIKSVPITDGWGIPFEVKSEQTHYLIVSAGSDKTLDIPYPDSTSVSPKGPVEGYATDIIYSDGQFKQYPSEIK